MLGNEKSKNITEPAYLLLHQFHLGGSFSWQRTNYFDDCRIASGAYYEAHQQLRVIAARYIKQANYDAAAELLAGGATALLRAGSQQGASASGGDLAIMLVVEVYTKAGWEITGGDDDTEGRTQKSKS